MECLLLPSKFAIDLQLHILTALVRRKVNATSFQTNALQPCGLVTNPIWRFGAPFKGDGLNISARPPSPVPARPASRNQGWAGQIIVPSTHPNRLFRLPCSRVAENYISNVLMTVLVVMLLRTSWIVFECGRVYRIQLLHRSRMPARSRS